MIERGENRRPGLSRRAFLGMVGAAGAASVLPSWAGGEEAAARPNVVFILADDIGAGHYGCYGDRTAKTPNIDGLAETGVVFRTCWATPMCSPSRALLATGRYANRTGVYHNALWIPHGGRDPRRFASDHLTFARTLKTNGYATAIAGKSMALGGGIDSPEVGFDEYCLHHGSFELPDGTTFQGPSEGLHRIPNSKPVASPCVVQNGKPVPTKADDFGPDIYTGFLVDFIRRNKEKPFLAYYSMNLPHGIAGGGLPTTPLSGRPGKLKGGTLAECNAYVDVLVGRIVKALEETGIRDRTIIFFTSDNGDASGAKTSATERGARIPMVINCPGIVKQRGATDELTDFSDVLPTLADFAGAKLPDGYEVDGKSLAPFLKGKTDEHREWIYSYIGTARMLRDKRWLLEASDPFYGTAEGRFYDCGSRRDGTGYKQVTGSKDPEVAAARKRFAEILSRIPPIDPNDPPTKEALEKYKTAPFRHRLR